MSNLYRKRQDIWISGDQLHALSQQEIFVSCKTLGMRAHEQFLSQPLIVFIFCFVFFLTNYFLCRKMKLNIPRMNNTFRCFNITFQSINICQ